MRGFLAVFERELTERRVLAVAALGFGLVAAALPLVPGFRVGGFSPAEVRGSIALGFCLLLSTLTALFLGGSVLASDLLERRMGFYFARPLSGWALWSGKIVAALVLAFGAGLLALLPAALLGSSFEAVGFFGMGGGLTTGFEAFVLWVLGLLLVFFAANALGLMVRSRSPWVALDMVALVLVVNMIWQARNRLLMAGVGVGAKNWWAGSINIFAWMGNTLVLVLLGSLMVAGAVQVVLGRTDVRRAHRALSATLWGTLIVLGIAFQALTLWWVRASPSDLMGVTQIASIPEGSSWIAFGGPAAHRPGYSPAFFYDVASGRSVPANLGPLAGWWSLPIRISADGRRAVWPVFQGIPSKSPLALQQLDLKRPGAEPEPARASLVGLLEGFALSPDGRRIAIATRNRLRVEDLDAGRLLASVPYGGEVWFSRLTFAGPDRVRLYRLLDGDGGLASKEETGFDILELDLKTGRFEQTGSIPDMHGLTGWSLSRDGERTILRTHRQLQLRDARTGELLAGLGNGASAYFLNDGRICLVSPAGELRILARDGVQELQRFRFQGARSVVPVDQPASGSLRVVTSPSGKGASAWDLRMLDLRTGTVRSLGTRKLVPLNPPSGSGSRLALEDGQGVIWKEPLSLRWRVVLRDFGAV
jgi:hypothetical protein